MFAIWSQLRNLKSMFKTVLNGLGRKLAVAGQLQQNLNYGFAKYRVFNRNCRHLKCIVTRYETGNMANRRKPAAIKMAFRAYNLKITIEKQKKRSQATSELTINA